MTEVERRIRDSVKRAKNQIDDDYFRRENKCIRCNHKIHKGTALKKIKICRACREKIKP